MRCKAPTILPIGGGMSFAYGLLITPQNLKAKRPDTSQICIYVSFMVIYVSKSPQIVANYTQMCFVYVICCSSFRLVKTKIGLN